MRYHILCTVVIGLLAGLSLPALAAEDRGGVKWGPFRALPRINLGYTTTDNYFRENNLGKATGLVIVNPGLRLEAGTSKMKYILDADLEIGEVTRSHDDDYTDLALSGQAIYQPNSRSKLDMTAKYQKEHNDRGTARTEGRPGLILKPDEYNQSDLGTEFTYGGIGAKGQIILKVGYRDIGYTNNRVGTRVRDRDEFGQGGIFKWRVGPKTTVLFEARNKDFNYDFLAASANSLDSDEQRYFVGVEWKATYKTTGALRIGRMNKNFDSGARKDISEGSWEANITWKPRSYSVVDVSTGRTFGETNGTGNVTLTDYFSISWDHKWRDRFSTVLSYDYGQDEYPGSATATAARRVDDTDTYRIAVNYDAKRWLKLGAGFEYIDKTSNVSAFEYERNSLFISAKMQF